MVTQSNAQKALPVRLEYTDFKVVTQILAWGYEGFTGRITHYSLQYLEYGILHYLVDGTKDYILTVDQFETGLEAIAPKPETEEYAIASTYDNNGTQVDVVLKSDGLTIDCRHCWTEEEGLDGEIVFCLETSTGKVVRSNWKTAQNNRWLNAYRRLWTERNKERVARLQAIAQQETDEEEIEYIRSLEAAMY